MVRVIALAVTLALFAGVISMPRTSFGSEQPPLKGEFKEDFVLFDPPVPAPQTSFSDGSGHELTLSDFSNRVILLNFWATWCPPCVWEMPTLNRLQARLKGEGLAVVTVSTDYDGHLVVAPFLKRYNLVHLKPYLDPKNNLKRHFGFEGLPTTVLIDAQGRVVGKMVGAAEWDSADAIALVRYYLQRKATSSATLSTSGASAWMGGGDADDAAAFQEWTALAEQGDVVAQFNLAYLYDSGIGVAQDQGLAANWYRKAAEQGDADALFNLAVLFANGEGVTQDFVVAYLLFDVAATADPEAAQQRDIVSNHMTSAQVDQAETLAVNARQGDTLAVVRQVLSDASFRRQRPLGHSTGPAPDLIRETQKALTALGYDAGPADGMLGSRTRRAISAFQSDAEFTVDGEATNQLLNRLQAALSP